MRWLRSKSTDLVFADHDLLDELAVAELHEVGAVERAHNLATSDEGQPLHTLEVGVLDGKDAFLSEERLWVVVDELPVDEAVDAVRCDCLNFRLHLFLRRFELREQVSRLEYRQVDRTRSARSSSASFPVLSTFTRAPKILILSVSIAIRTKSQLRQNTNEQSCAVLTGVRDEDLGILEPFGAVDANGFVKDESCGHGVMTCREMNTHAYLRQGMNR